MIMPANSGYDRVPLLDHDTEGSSETGKRWEEIDDTDRNGNLVYNVNSKKPKQFSDPLPETRIQLYPEFISQSSSSSPSFPQNENKFPKERRKAVIGFFLMALGFICNSISIVLTHQKVPDRTLHPPLPDISLDNFTKHRWLNDVADILVIFCTFSSIGIIILHRHRWILVRRVFVILSILYFMRSFTMYATVLPLANTHVYCSPKINTTSTFGQTALIVAEEVIKLLAAGGLPITGKKTMCGDYIFSGHTIIFMMAYLLIREYVPRKISMLHWLSWTIAWLGMICLLISHGHYTIDVIIAYYATTRMFWIYHAFSNHSDLQKRSRTNSLSEVWWFPIFKFFEGNVKSPIPKEYAVPRIKRGRILVYINTKEFLE